MKIRSLFLGAFGVAVFCASFFAISTLTSSPVEAALTSCVTAPLTGSQPNAEKLRYAANWTVSVPTSTSACYYSWAGAGSPANAGRTNELAGPITPNFLCGYGETKAYDFTSSSYFYGNTQAPLLWSSDRKCHTNFTVPRTTNYEVHGPRGGVMNAGDRIKVGDSISILLNASQYTFARSVAGAYINLPANSYINDARVSCPTFGPNAGKCSYGNKWYDAGWVRGNTAFCGGTNTPACRGVNVDPTWTAGAQQYDRFYSASTLQKAETTQHPVTGEWTGYQFTLDLDDGWGVEAVTYPDSQKWRQSSPTNVASGDGKVIPLIANRAGKLRFRIYDNGTYLVMNRTSALNPGFTRRPVFNAFHLSPGFVAEVEIDVDPAPVDNPPTTPVLTCALSGYTFADVNTKFVSTDPDPGDNIFYELDSSYDGSRFDVDFYTGQPSGVQVQANLRWADPSVKRVAVRAKSLYSAYSGIATCDIPITDPPPVQLPNLQFAVDASESQYTDNVAYYEMSRDDWGSAAAGLLVPARYVGASQYERCVVTPYPRGDRNVSQHSGTFTTSWDSWPTLASGSNYVGVPGGLRIKGIAASAPAAGSMYTFDFQYGCGSSADANAGNFSGSPDIQTVTVRIVEGSASGSPSVRLRVGKQGSALSEHPQASSPYVFPDALASSGAVVSGAVGISWDAANVTSCRFTRSDLASPRGSVTGSTWFWNNTRTTASAFSGTDTGQLSFSSAEALPSYAFAFRLTCASAQGDVSSSAYIQFDRSDFQSAATTFTGTVFDDAGGILGIKDAGEAGLAGREITVTVSGYAGGPSVSTATTNASGVYTVTINPTKAMAGGLVTIALTTPLPAGWSYTYPLTGSYTDYAMVNGATRIFDFGVRSGEAAYSTVTGKVYRDVNDSGIQEVGEAGIANQQVRLQRIITYPSSPTVTEDLLATTTSADGSYSLSAYVSGTPAGALKVEFAVSQAALPGAGWRYSFPLNGRSVFAAVPNTITHVDFGNVPPVSVRGTVFVDQNGSGQPSGQQGIGGANVQVYDLTAGAVASVYNLATGSSIPVQSVASAADGSYSFALQPSTLGHTIQIRQVNRVSPNVYCTNPGEGSAPAPDPAKYCEYPAEYVGMDYGLVMTRNFGNNNEPSATVNVVSGRVYDDRDGIAGYNGSADIPLAAVTVDLYDADSPGVPVIEVQTDSAGSYFYSVLKNSEAYNRLLGRRIIVRHTPPAGYHALSPGTGEYPPSSFDGASFANYDFIDAADGVVVPPAPTDTGRYCIGE